LFYIQSKKMVNLSKEFWTQRYLEQNTGWDIGHVSTPLKEYIDQIRDRSLKILIPGAGYAHEAAYLIEQGFTNVSIIDLARPALNRVAERIGASPYLHLIEGDFFEHEGQYDLILEQTFFCALDPSLREAYVQKMHSLLKEGGKLVGVLFNTIFERTGPPFGGKMADYQRLFSTCFTIAAMEECYNSIPSRSGSECFFIAKK
jgi:SAM-dependent methyltransferase